MLADARIPGTLTFYATVFMFAMALSWLFTMWQLFTLVGKIIVKENL